MISLLNTYKFVTNHDDEILIKALFEEEAINEFQKKHQRIGPRYYKPVVFVSVKKLSIAEILTHAVSRWYSMIYDRGCGVRKPLIINNLRRFFDYTFILLI